MFGGVASAVAVSAEVEVAPVALVEAGFVVFAIFAVVLTVLAVLVVFFAAANAGVPEPLRPNTLIAPSAPNPAAVMTALR